MNKLKAIICAGLSLCILAVPAFSAVINVAAEETTEDRIAELDAKSAEYQEILDSTATDISEKEAYGEALLSQISVLNEKIILTRESIEKTKKSIAAKETELSKGNSEIDGQIDALCNRLSIIYMAGSASNLEILLGAKDFGDFIDKVSLVKTLSDYDQEMINELNSKLEGIEKQKNALEEEQKKQEAEEAKLKKDFGDLNKLVQQNTAVLSELTKKSETARAALSSTNSKTSRLEAEEAAQVKQEQAAAKSSSSASTKQPTTQAPQQSSSSSGSSSSGGNSSSGSSSSSGGSSSSYYDDEDDYSGGSSGGSSSGGDTTSGSGYTWPCPGFYFLSSLWNEDRTTYNHGAIDIAGWGDIWGAPVVAADSGTVADTVSYCTHNYPKDMSESCGCGGGYGNYVWLDHGNGKETIYAHLTSLTVSPGQYVTKGQVIGYVGTTGHSTGPHLHFECRYYGSKYNPKEELEAYWGQVSYY